MPRLVHQRATKCVQGLGPRQRDGGDATGRDVKLGRAETRQRLPRVHRNASHCGRCTAAAARRATAAARHRRRCQAWALAFYRARSGAACQLAPRALERRRAAAAAPPRRPRARAAGAHMHRTHSAAQPAGTQKFLNPRPPLNNTSFSPTSADELNTSAACEKMARHK
jgi:hypothetical protein